MKNLIMLNGTMGVGKTKTSQQLKELLANSVFLDGDWCWDASPFIVTEETKEMVINNITTLLNNFIACSAYENIIFCWVMDEQDIIDRVVEQLVGEYTLFTFSLICNDASLIKRLKDDIEKGKRKVEIIQRSLERNNKYKNMFTKAIDVSQISSLEAAHLITSIVEEFPIFTYYPNAKEVFERQENNKEVICECCGKKTKYYYTHMYTAKKVDCICPICVSNGEAAKKFNGQYNQDIENYQNLPKEISNAILYKTPGYYTWQGEYWLTHCKDACMYLGDVGITELKEMGIFDEVMKEYEESGGYLNARENLVKKGNLAGYLFRCRHCGKYKIWVDAS